MSVLPLGGLALAARAHESASPAHAVPGTAGRPVDPALHKAAQELEGLFVRQLVAAAKLGGEGGATGYGAMAVDALAAGIQAAGGLGLARPIEDAITRACAADARPPPAAASAPRAEESTNGS